MKTPSGAVKNLPLSETPSGWNEKHSDGVKNLPAQ